MIANQMTYKFSVIVVLIILPTLLLFIIPLLVLIYYCFYISYVLGIASILPVAIIVYDLIAIYLRWFYCLIIGKPALIISRDLFVDNINNQIYKWEDVKQIGFHPKENFGGYLWIKLNKSSQYRSKRFINRIIAKLTKKYFVESFTIQPNLIKGSKKVIAGDIIKFYSAINLGSK
jgi:hypothetical protein